MLLVILGGLHLPAGGWRAERPSRCWAVPRVAHRPRFILFPARLFRGKHALGCFRLGVASGPRGGDWGTPSSSVEGGGKAQSRRGCLQRDAEPSKRTMGRRSEARSGLPIIWRPCFCFFGLISRRPFIPGPFNQTGRLYQQFAADRFRVRSSSHCLSNAPDVSPGAIGALAVAAQGQERAARSTAFFYGWFQTACFGPGPTEGYC